jgi:hypothetical protein
MLLPGSPPSPVVACANAVSDPPPGLASIAGGILRQHRELPSWLACLSSSCGLDMQGTARLLARHPPRDS